MNLHPSKTRIGLVIAAVAFALCLASCKKTPDTIGDNLISENNIIGVGFTDTVSVIGHSYLDDSIGTKNVRFGLLGGLNDPVFGPMQAGFYTQFRFSTTGQIFGNNPVIDSVVLQMSLSAIYGDTTCPQTVQVYELADTISSSESYYSYSEIPVGTIDLANGFQFVPRLGNHTQVIGNDTITQPIIRIPLSNELGNYLVQLDSAAYTQPDLFKSLFKGLRVVAGPTSQTGAICSINLTNNSLTRLQVYYHDAALPENTLRYDYYISSVENYFNRFEHDYTQGEPAFVQQVLEGDTALGLTRLYVQATGGIRTRISFPNIRQWAESFGDNHIVINEARLVIPASPADIDTTIFKSPSKLVLVGFKEDGTTYILPDNYEGSTYFGGSYNAATGSVFFRITEYCQRVILDKEPNFGLSIGIDGAAYNPQRLVMNGPNATEGPKMRLEITYSIVSE